MTNDLLSAEYWLQDDEGGDVLLVVTEPDPPDGSVCVHLGEQTVLEPDRTYWIRICPADMS